MLRMAQLLQKIVTRREEIDLSLITFHYTALVTLVTIFILLLLSSSMFAVPFRQTVQSLAHYTDTLSTLLMQYIDQRLMITRVMKLIKESAAT